MCPAGGSWGRDCCFPGQLSPAPLRPCCAASSANLWVLHRGPGQRAGPGRAEGAGVTPGSKGHGGGLQPELRNCCPLSEPFSHAGFPCGGPAPASAAIQGVTNPVSQAPPPPPPYGVGRPRRGSVCSEKVNLSRPHRCPPSPARGPSEALWAPDECGAGAGAQGARGPAPGRSRSALDLGRSSRASPTRGIEGLPGARSGRGQGLHAEGRGTRRAAGGGAP